MVVVVGTMVGAGSGPGLGAGSAEATPMVTMVAVAKPAALRATVRGVILKEAMRYGYPADESN